jgi:hypothetical protein
VVVVEREEFSIPLNEGYVVANAEPVDLPTPHLEHRTTKIEPHDLDSTLRSPIISQRQVGGPGTDVQDRSVSLGPDRSNRATTPPSIDPEREEVVQKIISVGNFTKHPPHPIGRLVDFGVLSFEF